ncbi:MAG: hypothetical protein PUI24_01220 [Spirochaetales bacterium]|nr:hypothetical protein [Spirochaetia bacterium]MDD7013587.1 hypothetical protein [Spirochaetales bacterium]
MNELSQNGKAVNIINRLLPLLDEAERNLSSARNWSIFDVLGGGFIVDLFKHSKLSKAQGNMEQVNSLMNELSCILRGINIPADCTMEVGNFVTFADFLFDGFFVDAYVTSKIMGSIDQVRKMKTKLSDLKKYLLETK